MYMAWGTRWQQHLLRDGFPNFSKCTWKLPSLGMALLFLFKENHLGSLG